MEIVLLPRLKSVLTLGSLVSFEHDTFLYGLGVLKMWSSLMFPENLWLHKDDRLKIGAPTKGNVGKMQPLSVCISVPSTKQVF